MAAVRVFNRAPKRTQRSQVHHLGDDLEQRLSARPRFAYAWSGPALKRLRVNAGTSLDQLATALGIAVQGLRKFAGESDRSVSSPKSPAPSSLLRGAPSNLVLTNGRRLSPEHRAAISAGLRRRAR